MEEWEDAKDKSNVTRFKLQNKYLLVNLHGSEPGDYDERCKIISIVWENSKGWFVCAKLGDDSDDATDVDANQSYAINVELHKLILAGNNPDHVMCTRSTPCSATLTLNPPSRARGRAGRLWPQGRRLPARGRRRRRPDVHGARDARRLASGLGPDSRHPSRRSGGGGVGGLD